MSHSSLAKLPLELLLQIGNLLPFKARLEFASTNAQLRQLMTPNLFSTVRITNKTGDVDAIRHVITKFRHYIRGIRLQCYLYPNPSDSAIAGLRPGEQNVNDSSRSEVDTLPDEVVKLLSGETLEQLQAIIIDFQPEDDFSGDGWGGASGAGSIYMHEEPEDENQVLSTEETSAWRRMMAHLWDVVSASTSVRHLETINLPPRATSAWTTLKWRSFLSRLEKLSIAIWGGDNGAGWHSNTTPGYADFLSKLNEYFFSHATNLVHLEIVADPGNPYGCEVDHSAPLALHPHYLTKLEVLELRHCIIDSSLIRFLKARAPTLQRLSFDECGSCIEYWLIQDLVCWADLLREFHASNPIISYLSITNASVPLTADEQFPEPEDCDEEGHFLTPDDEPEEIKAIRKSVKSDGKKLFSYIYLDDKYGMVFASEESNISRFNSGEDQREYDGLMSLVRQNAAAAAARTRGEASSVGSGEGNARSWATRRI